MNRTAAKLATKSSWCLEEHDRRHVAGCGSESLAPVAPDASADRSQPTRAPASGLHRLLAGILLVMGLGAVSAVPAHANNAPTGLPTISGVPGSGETLTASAAGIADADGLTGATFAWQWVANDGTADTGIAGATAAAYTLTSAEVGKTIKVRVTFTDDGGTEETLVSEATVAVKPPLTAIFSSVPESHDGSTGFTLDLHFSEGLPLSFRTLRDTALEASGGEVRRARRLAKGSNIGWRITVRPDTSADITVSLPVRACDATGAVCTSDARALSEGISVTVPGPTSQPREVSISVAGSSTSRNVTPSSNTVTEGTAAVFTLTRTGSLTSALTVTVDVSETGAMLKGTPATTVTFGVGSATAELSVETEDDEVAESASAVTAALAAGSGYSTDANASSATVTVEDDDAAPVIADTGPFTVDENTTAVTTLTATDDDTPVTNLEWSIAGGADAAAFTLSAGGDLAFAAAKDFEAPDDADGDGAYEVTVRVTDGANPAEATLAVSLADVDEVAPVLSSATVIGDTLTLTFGKFLDGNSVPGSSAFTATVDGTARSVDAVAVLFDTVTLTLASAAASGETVTVGYTAPTGANASPLQDPAGNPVAGFSNEAVTNDTAAVARVGLYMPAGQLTEATGWRIDVMRTGDTSAELTVNLSVTETGSMLDGTPPASVTIPAGAGFVALGRWLKDDMIDEPDSEVTITILAGTGYQPSDTSWDGTSLTFTVQDNDEPPVITTESPILVPENQVAITRLGANARYVYAPGATDPAQQLQQILTGNLPLIWWSLVGGADEDKFTLNARGELAFKAAKDFEAPDDADNDGDYEIEVRVDDGYNTTDGTLTVRLTDVSSTASGQPAISGASPQVGNVLAATKGTIDDDDGVPATLAYQWVRVDGSSESDIAGATSNTYTLGASDVGKQVKVKVSFTDNNGNAEGPFASDAYPTSGSVVAAKRACPSDADWCAEMTLWAAVDDGLLQGSRDYSATFSYSAGGRGSLSDDTVSHRGIDYTVTEIYRTLEISDARSYRYDSILIGVSGSELPDGTVFTIAGIPLTVGAGSDHDYQLGLEESWRITRLSLPAWFEGQKVTVSLKFPANSPPAGLPTMSGRTIHGTVEVGGTLTASADDIADDDGLTNATFAWQWIASDGNSDTDIAGATGSTYTLTSAELGKTIKVRVTFTDDQDTEETLVSEATSPVLTANASPTGLPTISGAVRVGETLTATAAGITDDNGLANATFAWRWLRQVRVEAWNTIGTGETYTLTSAELGKAVRVEVKFTDDEGHKERLHSGATVAVAMANVSPTGLPTISGTARVGESLTASASDIADEDGLTNATFAWQWLANDGTSDADIAGATAETYTPTAAEAGKTLKVRATFTDDGGTEETLVSDATAQVAVALPVVSITAASSPVTEGGAVSFTLSRTGDTAAELTVSVAVAEVGSVLSGTPASTVTIAAGDAESTLGVATDDDGTAEADGRVTATISAGTGYAVNSDSASSGVDVYDNDEAASTAAETLWTSTLTVQDIGGALLGYMFGNGLNPNGWSEDGAQFRVNQLHYFAQYEELAFTLSAGVSDPGQLTLHLDDLQVELSGASGEKYFYWTVEHPGWQAGQTVAVKLTRADPEAAVDAGPEISVADTQVHEAEGAVLSFPVTLAEAQTSVVTVRYATADGTATAGTDYVSVSGALRFAPGETAKTVTVPVLNDAHDEGRETLTLALSRPFGAALADGEATGTIMNTDPMPQAWLTRFGRTVGSQVVDAVTARLDNGGGSHVTVGGVSLGGSGSPPAEISDWNEWDTGRERRHVAREIGERELLLGSSFQLSSGERADGGSAFTAWGRVASDGFEGDSDDVDIDGDVTTAFIGFDAEWDRALAGLLLSQSRGEGSYVLDTELGNDRGNVESDLTGVYPYARLAMSDRVSVWGVAGIGGGELTLHQEGGTPADTDLTMRMGAVGVKGTVLDGAGRSGIGVNVKSDAMWVRTEADGAEGFESADGEVTRLRLVLEGERGFATGDGATLTPSGRVALRHDGGDAETGIGVEMGAGIRYTTGALTVEGHVRALVAHEASGYEEWGASGAMRVSPDASGRGLTLTLAPTWGSAASATERLWSGRDVTTALAIGDEAEAEAEGRLEATIGYGMPVLGGRFTGTPELGLGLSERGRDWRLGWRLGLAGSGPVAFDLGAEATRREPANGDAPENRFALTATMRW